MTRDQFNDYVRKQSRKLYSFAFRILRNQEEAEDVVQEIFIKLWGMREKLDEYRSIDALATAMTRNYCIDQVRKRKIMICDNDVIPDNNSWTSPSPHEQMEIRETDNIIRMIMEDLPYKYKNILKLRDIDGLSYEEIAIETDQNINSLRVIISRARALLRDMYNKYDNEKRGIR